MNYGVIARTLGYVMMVEGFFIFVGGGFSANASDGFLSRPSCCVYWGYHFTRIKSKDRFFVKEGLMIAGLSWPVMVVIGGCPLYRWAYPLL